MNINKQSEQKIKKLLEETGVEINGKNPWDPQIKENSFYSRAISGGSLALGESYMDGAWECQDLEGFFYRILKTDLNKKVKTFGNLIFFLKTKIFNLQNKTKALEVGEQHYDAGNDLYKKMLDKRMVYTCGYWKNANNLDEAQENKLDLICRKMKLKAGMKILDIGCGWGSFAKFAAEKYGVSVVGITISKEQVELGNKLCEGLPVEIRFQDYRDVNEKFDAIVSIGMFEHVGPKNYREYFKVANRCLDEGGIFLLHTIGGSVDKRGSDAWTDKYIFPNGVLPSISQVEKKVRNLFIIEDLENFGSDYNKTLKAWRDNFIKGWPEIKDNYNNRFYRMWDYYLSSFAGGFRARNIQLWQFVLTKGKKKGGYESVR